MNTIPDLIPLCDNRPGLRTLLQVEVSEPHPDGVSQKETKQTKDPESGAAVLDFVSSTATLDRYHEIIEPAGWQLDAYHRNPVFQNAHNYGDILFTLGKALTTEVRTIGSGQALCQRIQFATEVNPVARIAYGLYKGGFLNAVSVGFIPLRWEDGGTGSTNGQSAPAPRRRYLEQELLEVSAVAIPANPDALALGVESGAIAKGDLQATLDILRALVGTPSPQSNPQHNQWLDLARELRRVMQRA
jgi:hypothetical protein